jgi:hypothetical protein
MAGKSLKLLNGQIKKITGVNKTVEDIQLPNQLVS